MEKSLKEEEVLALIKQKGLEPLYIQELKPAKHIFSHIIKDICEST